MFRIPNAKVVTEIEALKILAYVEAKQVVSGSVDEPAGLVVLVVKGEKEKVKKAVSIVKSIKGEPPLQGSKGTCEGCLYTCRYAGIKADDLPACLVD